MPYIGNEPTEATFVASREYLINVTTAQSDFTLPDAYTYTVGVGALELFLDGLKLTPTEDFVEMSNLSFSLTFDAQPGQEILAKLTDTGLSNSAAETIIFQANGVGAVARSVTEKLRESVSVKDFGAIGNGVADDTAAIQAAIDSFGDTTVNQRGGAATLLCPGFFVISDTITIRRKAIKLVGGGWGYNNSNGSGFIWNGAAGKPMFKIQDVIGFSMKNLRFIGKSTAKPSAAINFNETNDGWPISSCLLEHILIGALSGETDDAEQFTDGILLDGYPVNNAEHQWKNIFIRKVSGDGIHIGDTQNVDILLDGAAFNNCATTAIHNAARIVGSNWAFANNALDLYVPSTDDDGTIVNGLTRCDGWFSEVSGGLAKYDGGGVLDITGLSFSISASLNANGRIIEVAPATAFSLRLSNPRFVQLSTPPASPLFYMPTNLGTRHIDISGAQAWSLLTGGVNGIDVTTSNSQDRTYIRFSEASTSTGRWPMRVAENHLQGQVGLQWNMFHRDSAYGDTTLRLWDDFLGDSLDTRWDSKAGSDPQVVAPAALAGSDGGVCRMVTGDDAAATMAVNGVQLQSALNWTVTRNPLNIEVRLKMSAITDVMLFVGFTDQVATLEAPFELAAGDALTSNATNATGVLFDTAADTDNWWLVGVATDVDATKQNSAVAPVANTYETWRIEYEGTAANFYRNGVKVGTTMTGAVTGVAMTPVVAATSRGAASRNIDIDYVLVQSIRA